MKDGHIGKFERRILVCTNISGLEDSMEQNLSKDLQGNGEHKTAVSQVLLDPVGALECETLRRDSIESYIEQGPVDPIKPLQEASHINSEDQSSNMVKPPPMERRVDLIDRSVQFISKTASIALLIFSNCLIGIGWALKKFALLIHLSGSKIERVGGSIRKSIGESLGSCSSYRFSNTSCFK